MKEQYSAGDIEVLQGLEPVRKRPGMYIGSTDRDGLRYLVREVIDAAIEHHLRRLATELHVTVAGPWVTVRDDGPGIPVDVIGRAGERASVLELVMTRLGCGPTYDADRPTGGLHGTGLPVVNALAARLEIETTRDGIRWAQAYERGKRVTPLRSLGAAREPGTLIRFQPDPTIFTCEVTADAIRDELETVAWLEPLLRVTFQEHRLPGLGGPAAWARELARPVGPIVASAAIRQHVADAEIDLALAWCAGEGTVLRSFVHRRETPDGGTHVDGLWQGLAAWAHVLGAPQRSPSAAREVLGRGLVAILHVGVADPRWTTQYKRRLESPEAAFAVRDALVRDARHRFRWASGTLQDVLRERLGIALP